jgi:hypothetical protein
MDDGEPMDDEIFGDAGSKARTYIPVRHPDHVALIYSALHLVEDVLAVLEGQARNKQGILTTTFFVRLREFARSSSMLLLYGQQNAASLQLRAVFEVVVYLKNCCERSEFDAEFVAATWRNLHLMAQVGVDNPGGFIPEAQREYWAERKRHVQAEKTAKGATLPSIEALARKAGLGAWYAYFYRMNSFHSHSAFVSLALRHLNFGDEGSISIDAGPKDTEFRMLSGTLVELIIIAIDALLKLFDLKVSDRLDALRQQHQILTAKDLAKMRDPNTARASESGSAPGRQGR